MVLSFSKVRNELFVFQVLCRKSSCLSHLDGSSNTSNDHKYNMSMALDECSVFGAILVRKE